MDTRHNRRALRYPYRFAVRVFIVCIFFLAAGGTTYATTYSSTNFGVQDPVIPGGAGYSTSNNFKLWSSIAQPSIGTSTSSSFGDNAGFLYFAAPTPSPSPTPTPTPTPPPSTGSGSITTPPSPLLPPRLPPRIPGLPPELGNCVRRSDFNCDGKVNLVDLSIFLSVQTRITARNLSLVFSDWTDRLLHFIPEQIASIFPRPQATQLKPPPPGGLAQVSTTLEPRPSSVNVKPSFFARIRGFFGRIIQWFVGLFHR